MISASAMKELNSLRAIFSQNNIFALILIFFRVIQIYFNML